MPGLAKAVLDDGPDAARRLFDDPLVEAIEMEKPPLDEHPYRDFVRAVRTAPGFKLDFNGLAPDQALAMMSDQLLGKGAYRLERAQLAIEIDQLAQFTQALVGGPPPMVAIRTYFAPGDLVWHLDRVSERAAVRLLWPLGRVEGMRVTPHDNIDTSLYRGYMHREHTLLCRLDTLVLRTGRDVEQLWAHRPRQLAALRSGQFPFVRDPLKVWSVAPNAVSVHRIQTPVQPGAYHRSSWANRRRPGFQIVITATSDQEAQCAIDA